MPKVHLSESSLHPVPSCYSHLAYAICLSSYDWHKAATDSKEVLREHKSQPIRRIQISDFGLPDPKCDPDRHQNCITWSLSHALPLQKISSKSVHKFASNLMDRQTNRQTNRQTDSQTDRTKNITSFFGGGNYYNSYSKCWLVLQHHCLLFYIFFVHLDILVQGKKMRWHFSRLIWEWSDGCVTLR